MKSYVDHFVLSVPKRRLAEYRKISSAWGVIMRDHGLLRHREFVVDDLPKDQRARYKRFLKAKPGEVLIFSVEEYPSKTARDRCNRDGCKDPRMLKMFDQMTFDTSRMIFGGWKLIVETKKGR